MQKGKLVLPILLTIFLIGFVSAAQFSIGAILDDFGGENLVLMTMFIIFFALINYALSKAMHDNKAVAGIVSFAITLLIVYGIYRYDFDVINLFSNFGIKEDVLSIAIPLALLISSLLIFWRLGLGILFVATGGLLLSAAIFTEFFYEAEAAGIIGGILLVLGLWLWNKKRKKDKGIYNPGLLRRGAQAGKYAKGKYKSMQANRDPRYRLAKKQAKFKTKQDRARAQREINEMEREESGKRAYSYRTGKKARELRDNQKQAKKEKKRQKEERKRAEEKIEEEQERKTEQKQSQEKTQEAQKIAYYKLKQKKEEKDLAKNKKEEYIKRNAKRLSGGVGAKRKENLKKMKGFDIEWKGEKKREQREKTKQELAEQKRAEREQAKRDAKDARDQATQIDKKRRMIAKKQKEARKIEGDYNAAKQLIQEAEKQKKIAARQLNIASKKFTVIENNGTTGREYDQALLRANDANAKYQNSAINLFDAQKEESKQQSRYDNVSRQIKDIQNS
jgi:hypothetical protein